VVVVKKMLRRRMYSEGRRSSEVQTSVRQDCRGSLLFVERCPDVALAAAGMDLHATASVFMGQRRARITTSSPPFRPRT
jgi:hypothetical protein